MPSADAIALSTREPTPVRASVKPPAVLPWTMKELKALMRLQCMRTHDLAQRTRLPENRLQAWAVGCSTLAVGQSALVHRALGVNGKILSLCRTHVFSGSPVMSTWRDLNALSIRMPGLSIHNLMGDHNPRHPKESRIYVLMAANSVRVLLHTPIAWHDAWIHQALPSGVDGSRTHRQAVAIDSELIDLVTAEPPSEEMAAELIHNLILRLTQPNQTNDLSTLGRFRAAALANSTEA